jgi:hypothetical protein
MPSAKSVFLQLDRDLKKAHVRATNKLLKSADSHAKKQVREVYNVKLKTLNKYFAVRKAKLINTTARLTLYRRSIGLLYFGARETSKGVTVRVRKDRGRKLIRSGFIRNMKSGHTNIFTRLGKKRLPIAGKYTVGAADMYVAEGLKVFERTVYADAQKILNQEINFVRGYKK